MKRILEINLGKILVLCVIITVTVSNVFAKHDKLGSQFEISKDEGMDDPGPACNC